MIIVNEYPKDKFMGTYKIDDKIYYNILNKNIKKNVVECKLNKNIFNPTKNSPINNWQCRLIKRLNDLDKCDLIKFDSFKLDLLNSN